ncbi:hypothetical protein D3C77_282180 [compost metagenome]
MMLAICPAMPLFKLKQGVAFQNVRGYIAPVAANSATGFCSPNIVRRISATVSKAGAFFMPAYSFYGGCAWGAFERAGFLTSRSANLRTAATQFCFAAGSGGSSTLGAVPVDHDLNPSKIRAAMHRAMAIAALHANSSLATRLKRYNAAMAKARALESAGGVL